MVFHLLIPIFIIITAYGDDEYLGSSKGVFREVCVC